MIAKAILFLLALAAVSCATVRDGTAEHLVGRWRATIDGRTAEYAFRADGTFSGSVKSHGAIFSNFTGRWSLNGKTIRYQYLTDTTANIPPGTRDQDTLVSLAQNSFVIKVADGSRRTYSRIVEKHR